MAEETGQERTEDPTGKRLSDARQKGQVARSKELSTFIILIVGSVAIFLFGNRGVTGLGQLMRGQFKLDRTDIFDKSSLIQHFGGVMQQAIEVVWPFLLLMVIASFVGPLSISGWLFSLSSMQPKLEKFDPIKGLGKMFGVRSLVELLKSIVKILLLFGVTATLFTQSISDFVGLSGEPLHLAITHGGHLIGFSFFILCATVGLIAIIDVPFQLWDFKRNMKMTLQEVKDEMKDSEGQPEVKNRIRSLQMELAQGRMMDEVPKADVIVTNPTHYAVALKYDQQSADAPKVVAKGMNLVAAHIRNLANGSRVPIISAPPLARALYFSTELDTEIPNGLFLAVAQVLAYVYQLKSARIAGNEAPEMPRDLPIPDEYKVGAKN